jgi:hypothetical protein
MLGSTREICLSLQVTADALEGMAEGCDIGRVALANTLIHDGGVDEHQDIRDSPD